METQVIEYKSLQKIKTGDKGFKELAKTCVCLANAQGGKILIGFDDKTQEPPSQQKIIQKFESLTKYFEQITIQQQSKLSYLKALKASLLDKAFKGEM